MPNGGSDCCGTCWFNQKNMGEAGYAHAGDPEPDRCAIRDLRISDPFYTYCGNHPYRRPEKDPIPIGPVFVDSPSGREIWISSPDTEEIRQHLVELADEVGERREFKYPIGSGVNLIVIWQLGEFREGRATGALRRIASFDAIRPRWWRRRRTLRELAPAAVEALRKIEGSD